MGEPPKSGEDTFLPWFLPSSSAESSLIEALLAGLLNRLIAGGRPLLRRSGRLRTAERNGTEYVELVQRPDATGQAEPRAKSAPRKRRSFGAPHFRMIFGPWQHGAGMDVIGRIVRRLRMRLSWASTCCMREE